MWRKFVLSIGLVMFFVGVTQAQTIGYWEFNTIDDITLHDSSGNDFNGILGFPFSTETDPHPTEDSPSSSADDYALQGGEGAVVVDDSEHELLDMTGQEFTAEIWLKIDEPLEGKSWLGTIYYGRHGQGWGIGFQNQNVKFTLFGVVDMFPGIELTNDGQWHHLAFAYTPNVGVDFYLDGEWFTFMEETRDMNAPDTNILWIGAEDGASRPLPGKMDRFRVTQGLVPQEELDSDPDNPKPVTDDTIVYFPFNEEEGAVFETATTPTLQALAGSRWFQQKQAPDYVEDSPSGNVGDYALEFVRGDHAVIDDPDEQLNFQDESFTIETWIQRGDIPGTWGSIVYYSGMDPAPDDQGGYALRLNGDSGILRLSFFNAENGDVDSANAVVPDDGEWHHIAAAYSEDNFTVTFYLDGQESDVIEYFSGILPAVEEFVLHIGGNWDGRDPFVGALDRLRITNAALSAGELDSTAGVAVQGWELH